MIMMKNDFPEWVTQENIDAYNRIWDWLFDEQEKLEKRIAAEEANKMRDNKKEEEVIRMRDRRVRIM